MHSSCIYCSTGSFEYNHHNTNLSRQYVRCVYICFSVCFETLCSHTCSSIFSATNNNIIYQQLSSPVPSGPPLNLVAVSTSSHSAFLSWSPPSTQQRNGIITGYLVHIVAESGRQSNYSVETTHYNFSAASITPYTMYYSLVAAKTVNGMGPFSEMATVRTLEDGMLN